MFAVITIDGASGAGKGTIAQAVARKLGWQILDSGSLYRLTALASVKEAVSLDYEVAIENLVRNLDVRFESTDSGLRILLKGEDVSEAIRAEEMGMMASKVAAMQGVRAALLERQRDFSTAEGLVADGRDMGTTVFPDAALKVFMTASVEERAQRRFKQLKEKGISVNIAALVEDLKLRDEQDANRKISPLKPADDAVMLDTTSMTIEQVTQQIFDLVGQRFSI